jgi:hypothetical protein
MQAFIDGTPPSHLISCVLLNGVPLCIECTDGCGCDRPLCADCAQNLPAFCRALLTKAMTVSHGLSTVMSLLRLSGPTRLRLADPIEAVRRTAPFISEMMKAVLVDVVLPHLKEPIPINSELLTLCRQVFLLDPQWSQFYVYNGAVKPAACPASDSAWFAVPPSGASKYFIDLLTYFADIGGYEAIVSRLDVRNTWMTLEEVSVWASILWVGKHCYTEKWANTFWKRAFDSISARLEVLVLSPEEPAEPVHHTVDVMNDVLRVHRVYYLNAIPLFKDDSHPRLPDSAKLVAAALATFEWQKSLRCVWVSTILRQQSVLPG